MELSRLTQATFKPGSVICDDACTPPSTPESGSLPGACRSMQRGAVRCDAGAVRLDSSSVGVAINCGFLSIRALTRSVEATLKSTRPCLARFSSPPTERDRHLRDAPGLDPVPRDTTSSQARRPAILSTSPHWSCKHHTTYPEDTTLPLRNERLWPSTSSDDG